jgi:hypothetical protein
MGGFERCIITSPWALMEAGVNKDAGLEHQWFQAFQRLAALIQETMSLRFCHSADPPSTLPVTTTRGQDSPVTLAKTD